jgi:hypothetical protein
VLLASGERQLNPKEAKHPLEIVLKIAKPEVVRPGMLVDERYSLKVTTTPGENAKEKDDQ